MALCGCRVGLGDLCLPAEVFPAAALRWVWLRGCGAGLKTPQTGGLDAWDPSLTICPRASPSPELGAAFPARRVCLAPCSDAAPEPLTSAEARSPPLAPGKLICFLTLSDVSLLLRPPEIPPRVETSC